MEWDLSGVGRVFTVIRVCFWLTIIIASLWWRNGGNWTLKRKIVYAIALLFLTFLTILLYDWPLWDLFGALILGLLIWFLLSRRGVKQGPTATPEKD